jgi:hypothetical protein
VQRRDHRPGRDVERLEEKRLDDDRDDERKQDEHRQLGEIAEEAAPLLLLGPLLYLDLPDGLGLDPRVLGARRLAVERHVRARRRGGRLGGAVVGGHRRRRLDETRA